MWVVLILVVKLQEDGGRRTEKLAESCQIQVTGEKSNINGK